MSRCDDDDERDGGGGASSSGGAGGGNGGERRMTRLQEKKPAHVRLDTETTPMEENGGEEEVRVTMKKW